MTPKKATILLTSAALAAGLLSCARSGVAQPRAVSPLDAFAGSDACAACHARIAGDWNRSPHGRHAVPVATLLPAASLGGASQGDADPRDESRASARGSVGGAKDGSAIAGVGGTWMQAFLREDADGFHRILSRCFDVRAKTWRPVSAVLEETGGTWLGRTAPPPVAVEKRTFEADCAGCHATASMPRLDLDTGRMHAHAVEGSIGCESCHGPGRAHRDAWERLEPGARMPDLARLSSAESTAVCARCHGGPAAEGDFAPGDAKDFVGGIEDRRGFFPDGRASGQVYQYAQFVRSPCHAKGGLACVSCHDPHGPGLRPLPNLDALCTRCHAEKASSSHTFHDPGGDGARCVECHMPRLLGGLLAHQRDHRIGVPLPAVAEAPDACTACHRTRTKAWADEAWRARWGAPPAATLEAVVAIARAREGDATAEPLLRRALSHPDPFFRANAGVYLRDPTAILSDAVPEVRLAAVTAAATSASPLAALRRLALDPALRVRAAALVELARLGAPIPPGAPGDLAVAVHLVRASTDARILLASAERERGNLEAAARAILAAVSYDPDLRRTRPDLADFLDAVARPHDAAGVRLWRAEHGLAADEAARAKGGP